MGGRWRGGREEEQVEKGESERAGKSEVIGKGNTVEGEKRKGLTVR